MNGIFINACKYSLFLFVLGLSGAVFAQTGDDSAQQVVPPAWATPAPPPGLAPLPNDPNQQGTDPGANSPDQESFFFPQSGNDSGFDYFQDDDLYFGDDYGGGGGSRGRSRGSEGKSSFRFVDPPKNKPVCKKWGNVVLGDQTFRDQSSCEYELDLIVDEKTDMISALKDHIERFKLKKVIRGEIRSRKDAEKYRVEFDQVKGVLEKASDEGCQCIAKD